MRKIEFDLPCGLLTSNFAHVFFHRMYFIKPYYTIKLSGSLLNTKKCMHPALHSSLTHQSVFSRVQGQLVILSAFWNGRHFFHFHKRRLLIWVPCAAGGGVGLHPHELDVSGGCLDHPLVPDQHQDQHDGRDNGHRHAATHQQPETAGPWNKERLLCRILTDTNRLLLKFPVRHNCDQIFHIHTTSNSNY